MYPSRMLGHCGGESVFSDVANHLYGVVLDGRLELRRDTSLAFPLTAGMYFSAPGPSCLSGTGTAAIFLRMGYRGLFEIGGPVERSGRLCYIDNCRSTVLISPPRLGDPCLNLLTFPPGIQQSSHIHPTLRMGVVLSGTGKCVLRNQNAIELKPGITFFLKEGTSHCFHSHEELIVIAYHPDSDFGPTDGFHPMLNRTYLNK